MLTDPVKALMALVLGIKETTPHEDPWVLRTASGSVAPPPGDDSRFVPTPVTLEAALGGLTAAGREKAVRDRMAKVAGAWTKLESAASTQGQLAALRTARQVADAMPAQVSPLPAEYKPPDLAFWLRLDETPGTTPGGEPVGNNAAWSLVSAQISNPAHPVDVSGHIGSAAAAARILVQLRRLDDILGRFDAACRAWAEVGGLLATVLALYRTEGDLLIPPSRQSLDGTDVPAVEGVKIKLPPGRSKYAAHLAFTPGISHGVYVADKAKAKANGYELARVNDLASFSFWVMVAGLDDMFTQNSGQGTNVKTWLALNRPGLALPVATTRAWDAYSLGYGTLDRRPSSDDGSWVVTSDDPIAYVAGILAEGVRHMRLVGSLQEVVGGGLTGPLPDLLQYLRYHAGREQFQGIALSALVAARNSPSALAQPLRTPINAADAATKSALSATGATTAATVTLAAANWPTIATFLRKPGILSALDTFIGRAGTAEWASWTDHRANVMRYQRLLSFYAALFPFAVRP